MAAAVWLIPWLQHTIVNMVPPWNYIDSMHSCGRDPDNAKMSLWPAHVSTNSSRSPRRTTVS